MATNEEIERIKIEVDTGDAISELEKVQDKMEESLGGESSAKIAKKSSKEISDSFSETASSIEKNFEKSSKKSADSLEKISDSAEKIGKEFEKIDIDKTIGKDSKKAAEEVDKNLTKAVEDVEKKVDDLSRAFDKVDVSGLSKSIRSVEKEVEGLSSKIQSSMTGFKNAISGNLVISGLSSAASMINTIMTPLAFTAIKPGSVDTKQIEYTLKEMNIPKKVKDIEDKTKLSIKPELDEARFKSIDSTVKELNKGIDVDVSADPSDVEHIKQVVEDIPRKVRIELTNNRLDLGLDDSTGVIQEQEKKVVRISETIKRLNDEVDKMANISKTASAHLTPFMDKFDVDDIEVYSKEMQNLANIANFIESNIGSANAKMGNTLRTALDAFESGNSQQIDNAVNSLNQAIERYENILEPSIEKLTNLSSGNHYVGLKDDSAFKAIANTLNDVLKNMENSLLRFADRVTDIMGGSFDNAGQEFADAIDSIYGSFAGMDSTIYEIGDLVNKLDELATAFNVLEKGAAEADKFASSIESIPLVGKPLADFSVGITNVLKKLDGTEELRKEIEQYTVKLAENINSAAKGIDIEISIGKVSTDFSEIQAVFKNTISEFNEYTEKINSVKESLEEAVSDSDGLMRSFADNVVPKDALDKIGSLNISENLQEEIDKLIANSSSLQNIYDKLLEQTDAAMGALQDSIKDIDLGRIQLRVADMGLTGFSELWDQFEIELQKELANVGIKIPDTVVRKLSDILASATQIKSANFDTSGLKDITDSVKILEQNLEKLNADPLVDLLRYIEKQSKNLSLSGIADDIRTNGETFKTVFSSLNFNNLDFNKLSVLASRFTQLSTASEDTKKKLGDIYAALEQFEKDENLGLIGDGQLEGMSMFVDKIIDELKICSSEIDMISSEAGKKLRENLFSIDKEFITTESIGAIIKSMQDDINMYVDSISIDHDKVKELLSIPTDPLEIPVEIGRFRPTLSEVLRMEMANARQVLSNLTGIASDVGGRAANAIRNAFDSSALLGKLSSAFSGIKTAVSDAANSAKTAFMNTRIGQTLGNAFNTVSPHISAFKTRMLDAVNSVKTAFTNSRFAQAFAPLANSAKNIATGMRNSFKNAINAIKNADISKLKEAIEKIKPAVDKVKQAFTKMVDSVKGVVQRLKEGRQATKDMGTAAKSTNGIFQQLMSTLAPFLSIFAAINGIKSSIKLGLDATETESMYQTVFAASGQLEEMNEWIKEINANLGISTTTLQQNTATIYNFATNMGVASGEAVEMSKGIAQLAQDMASFYNMDPAEVFDNLKSALSGSAETVTKYGMNLYEANIKQYAYANGIAAVGTELTQGQKVMARYMLMMEQAGAASGDLARTLGFGAYVRNNILKIG